LGPSGDAFVATLERIGERVTRNGAIVPRRDTRPMPAIVWIGGTDRRRAVKLALRDERVRRA
jgi:hypothetical protein